MFKFILWGAGLPMKTMFFIAALMDKDFKNRLKERSITIVVKTLDGKNARTYQLMGGKFSSIGRDTSDPDMCISFSSAKDVFIAAFRPTPKLLVKSFTQAIRDGQMKIEFKVEPFAWFYQTLAQMMAVFCDRTKKKKFFFINA